MTWCSVNTYVVYTDLVVSVSTMFQVQMIEHLIKGGLNLRWWFFLHNKFTGRQYKTNTVDS